MDALARQDMVGQLLARYEHMVRGIVASYLRCQDDIDDVVQDIWLKALGRLPQVKRTRGLGTWLARIAHTTSIDSQRTASRRRRLLEGVDLDDSPWVAGCESCDLLDQSMRADLHAALSKLSQQDRVLLLLHYFDECTCRRIARLEGMSESAIKYRLVSARNRLARAMP